MTTAVVPSTEDNDDDFEQEEISSGSVDIQTTQLEEVSPEQRSKLHTPSLAHHFDPSQIKLSLQNMNKSTSHNMLVPTAETTRRKHLLKVQNQSQTSLWIPDHIVGDPRRREVPPSMNSLLENQQKGLPKQLQGSAEVLQAILENESNSITLMQVAQNQRRASEFKKAQTYANLTYQPRQVRLNNSPQQDVKPEKSQLEKKVRRCLKKMLNYDISCSICLSQFVKPVSLECGHSFCQFCILKFLLQYPKKCPLCRTAIKVCYQDFKVNVALDAISFKYNPRIYNKIRALNEREISRARIFEKLAQKFLDSQNYRPSNRERIHLFLHNIKRYYKRLRALITIVAPIIILFWYIKYRKRINSDQYWEEMRKHNMMFFSVPFDLTQETILVRLSQVFSILVGF